MCISIIHICECECVIGSQGRILIENQYLAEYIWTESNIFNSQTIKWQNGKIKEKENGENTDWEFIPQVNKSNKWSALAYELFDFVIVYCCEYIH